MKNIIEYKYPENVITVEKAIQILKSEYPEFWSSSMFKAEGLPYMLFQEFAQWSGEIINLRTPETYKSVPKIFSFINRLLENGNDEVINIVQVSFLETIVQYLDDTIDLSKILNNEGNKFLEKWRNYLNNRE